MPSRRFKTSASVRASTRERGARRRAREKRGEVCLRVSIDAVELEDLCRSCGLISQLADADALSLSDAVRRLLQLLFQTERTRAHALFRSRVVSAHDHDEKHERAPAE